jgi:fused signal recognition particle receptor
MAFSFFGKRDREPESSPEPDAQRSEQNAPRSFFDRMKQAVTRTRDEASLDDLELALLASDIGSSTTQEIINRLRERALRQGIADGAELRSLLKAEIRRILDQVRPDGGAKPIAHPSPPPEVIMMVGVNGTGKTTTTGKLAALFRKPTREHPQGRSVLLCAADTFRAAAIEQLEVWSQRSGVELIKTKQGGDPSAALFDAATAAKARGTDVLIVDTAGRLHTKSDLMKELDKMVRTAQKIVPGAPHQTLLVIDATTGQNGLQQARLFTEAAKVTGIVLTKLDGTAKGGIVVAIAHELGLPVLYAGVGEKIDDILPFEPGAFVESMLE